MYNEIQKQKYLDSCKYQQSTVKVIGRIFDSAELVERQRGMDLCYFNNPQVFDLLKSFNSKSYQRIKSNCVYLADYYNWCYEVENLVDSAENVYHYTNVEPMIAKIVTADEVVDKYFTKDELLKELEKVIDVTNKFIAYAFFSGIKGNDYEELINLKMGDLDESTHTLKLITGRETIVDDEFIYLMKKAHESTIYFPYGEENDTCPSSILNTYKQTEHNYVLKQTERTKGYKLSVRLVTHRIGIIKDQIGNEFISSTCLYKNGLIHYITKEYAKQGISFKEALTAKKNTKQNLYDEQTQKYIYEFGSKMTVRMLRKELKYYLELIE